MEDDDICGVVESVTLPKLYLLEASTKSRNDLRPLNAQKSIHEQATGLYCLQVSSTVGFPGSTKIYYRKDIFNVNKANLQSDELCRESFLCLYDHGCCWVSRITRHWLVNLPKDVCRTQGEGSIIGYMWPLTCTRPWEKVKNGSKPRRQKSSADHYIYSQQVGKSEFVVMDILGPRQKTWKWKQFMLALTDCYLEVMRLVPTSWTTACLSGHCLFTTGWSGMESPTVIWQ